MTGAYVLLILLTAGAQPVIHKVGTFSTYQKCSAAANMTLVQPRKSEPVPEIVFVCTPAPERD